MKRRLATLAAIASLLLCAATVALWVRSYDVGYIAGYVHGTIETQEFYGIGSLSGDVAVFWHEPAELVPRRLWFEEIPPDVGSFRPGASTSPLQFAYHPANSGAFLLVIPFWLVMIVSLLPAVPYELARCRQRVRAGCCRACGYDLRATPQRCPECGSMPSGTPVIRSLERRAP